MISALLFAIVGATQFNVETGLSGCDQWAGIRRHPARENEPWRENDYAGGFQTSVRDGAR